MSIFRKRKRREESGKTNLQKIEQELNCKFPEGFHTFLKGRSPEEIILELPDEKYRILESIGEQGNIDSHEDVVTVANVMKTHRALENGLIKLPFARNLSGDQFKYLFFEGKEGEEFQEKVFLADIDSLIGKLEVTNTIQSFDVSKANKTNYQLIVDFKPYSVKQLLTRHQLPETINYWKDSFGIKITDNIKEYKDGFSIQQHAINYEFEDSTENITKVEIQCVFSKDDKLFYTSSAYEIDNSQIAQSIEYNVEYRTFYYKFSCIIDTLKKSQETLKNKGYLSADEFYGLISIAQLIEFTGKVFRSFETRSI